MNIRGFSSASVVLLLLLSMPTKASGNRPDTKAHLIANEDTSAGHHELPNQSSNDRPTRVQFASLIGYGAKDWYNLGVGLRMGVTFGSGVYIGGIFVYHSGDLQIDYLSSGSPFEPNEVIGRKHHALYLGSEVGYDVPAVGVLTLRPYCTIGYSIMMASQEWGAVRISNSEGHSWNFLVSPGLIFNLAAGEGATIGVDGRYIVLAGENANYANAPEIFLSVALTP